MLAKARKVPINLSLRADLVDRARALELNVSDVVESVGHRGGRADSLAERDNAAMDYYNSFIENHGLFSDTFRKF